MNTNGLAKRYDALSAEERFRLLLAAIARDDDLEVDRIHQAAKRFRFSVHDTTGYMLGTCEALMWLMTQRLKLALGMTDMLYRAADIERDQPRRKKNKETDLAERSHKIACAFAYLLKIHTEAHRQFVEEVGASALENVGTSPLEPLRADEFLLRAESLAKSLAISAEEMHEFFFREHEGKKRVKEGEYVECEFHVKTTETVLTEARLIRDFFVEQWS